MNLLTWITGFLHLGQCSASKSGEREDVHLRSLWSYWYSVSFPSILLIPPTPILPQLFPFTHTSHLEIENIETSCHLAMRNVVDDLDAWLTPLPFRSLPRCTKTVFLQTSIALTTTWKATWTWLGDNTSSVSPENWAEFDTLALLVKYLGVSCSMQI